MTGDAKQAVKEELEDDLSGPISSLNRKLFKKEELIPKDEPDDDNTPLALSKAQKKRPSISPKVKKQEPEDDDDDDEEEKPLKKNEVLKKKSKPKSVKKELASEEEEEDGKTSSKKSRKRKRMEEKKTVVKVKKQCVSEVKINKSPKKEKKQYQLPGQKHEPPEMRDPLRIFYETLYEKVPTSEMAATWMMEHGLLPPEEAEKVYAKKLRKHQIQKFGSPGKVTPVKKSSTASVKKKVKVTSKTTMTKTKKNLDNSKSGEDCDENTTPSKKSSAVLVKKEVKVTSNTTAKKSKKNLSDSEADDDDDDFVLIKRKPGNRKVSA